MKTRTINRRRSKQLARKIRKKAIRDLTNPKYKTPVRPRWTPAP